MKGKLRGVQKVFTYIYSFLLLYMPELKVITGIESKIILGFMTMSIFLYCFTKRRSLRNLMLQKDTFFLILGIMLSIIYFMIVAIFTNNELRFLANSYVIVQICGGTVLIDILLRKGYAQDDIIKFILNTTMIQGIIVICMLFIPSLKNIALFIFYQGGEGNIFISRMRIYGISTDYTYFTPSMHAFLGILAFTYGVIKDKRFMKYIPLLLLIILLNGRTGFLVFIIGIGLSSLIMFKQKSITIIKYFASIIVLGIIIFYIISQISPSTFDWIKLGLNEILDFILDNDTTELDTPTTFDALKNMLFFPTGFSFLFGSGHRVYLYEGHAHSDIGFVNDLFMGGIVYILILYGSIFRFTFQKGLYLDKNNSKINKTISIIFFLSLLICNFKGECMRGGSILFVTILIKQVFLCKMPHIYTNTPKKMFKQMAQYK